MEDMVLLYVERMCVNMNLSTQISGGERLGCPLLRSGKQLYRPAMLEARMRAYIESYGCTLNQGEANEIEELLMSLGWTIAPDSADADLSVLVTCVVIEATENRMLKRLKSLSSSPRVIVTGCMATARREAALAVLPSAEFVLPGDLGAIAESVGRVGSPLSHPSGSRESGFSIVPIATGCMGECSYCITRLARGDLQSRPLNEIVEKVAAEVRAGPSEIRLTAQDTAVYGLDLGTDLVTLMESVLELESDFRVRIGMMNPNSVLPLLDRLPRVFSDRRVLKFLHLPVQSASDRLLSDMGRRYALADFERAVSTFRSVVPGLTLSTDIIVGYPGEDYEDHEANLELIRRVQPDIVNVTRYSPRPGTKAFVFGRGLVGWRAKDRSRELTDVRFEVSLAKNERLVGTEMRALATERGKYDSTILRADNYRQIVVGDVLPLRRFYDVLITDATPTYLVGYLMAK
jgi:threonylcarbamoyladenosine tRNA methylthiotransferase CDKAL1